MILQDFLVEPVFFIEEHTKIAQLAQHAIIFNPNLYQVGITEASLGQALEHLRKEQGSAAQAAVSFHHTRAVNIGPPRTA